MRAWVLAAGLVACEGWAIAVAWHNESRTGMYLYLALALLALLPAIFAPSPYFRWFAIGWTVVAATLFFIVIGYTLPALVTLLVACCFARPTEQTTLRVLGGTALSSLLIVIVFSFLAFPGGPPAAAVVCLRHDAPFDINNTVLGAISTPTPRGNADLPGFGGFSGGHGGLLIRFDDWATDSEVDLIVRRLRSSSPYVTTVLRDQDCKQR